MEDITLEVANRAINAAIRKSQKMNVKQNIAIVDVRERHEWTQGVIPRALLIPQGELWSRHSELPHDHKIITICAAGVRSARAASLLSFLGHPSVATVDRAGMNEWTARGYPVVIRNA